MSVPDHLVRHPTAAAIASLAERFGLPNAPGMQDWEWEVADSERVDEFVQVYEHEALTDDERFVLMETILQSFEDLKADLSTDKRWLRALGLLEGNIDIHVSSVWYWSCLDNEDLDMCWTITPWMRALHSKYERAYTAA